MTTNPSPTPATIPLAPRVLQTLPARLAILLTGVLFGVLVVAYGYYFGTGTDAWELYAIWTVGLGGFAALARLQGGWVLWLALVQVTAWATIHQEVTWEGIYSAQALPWVTALALLYAAVIAVLERRALRPKRPTEPARKRQVLVIYTALSIGLWLVVRNALDAIQSSFGVELLDTQFFWRSAAVVLALVALAATFVAYSRWQRDAFPLTLGAIGTSLILLSLLHRLSVRLHIRGIEFLLLMTLALVALVWTFRRWLRRSGLTPDDSWQPLGLGRAFGLAAAVGLVVTLLGWRYVGPLLRPYIEPWGYRISRLDYTFFFWPTTGLAAACLTLIVLRWWTQRHRWTQRQQAPHRREPLNPPATQPPWALAALALLVAACLAIPGVQFHQRQHILDTGRTIFLELSPTTLEQLETIASGARDDSHLFLRFQLHDGTVSPESLVMWPRRGLLVLDVDERGVATYFTSFRGWDLGEHQQLLQYRRRLLESYGAELRFGLESYFVDAERLELLAEARYAEVRVTEDGEAVLAGLRGPTL